jgi:hypothetical protein
VVPVPAAATTGNVVVTVNQVASNGVGFTVIPTITSLSPASALVGASVTITGSGFGTSRGTSTVTFNGTAATTINPWTNTSITVIVPPGATTGNVVVTVPGGFASNGAPFTVLMHPSVLLASSLNPSTYGTSVTFTATVSGNVGTPTGTITFNDGNTTIGTATINAGSATFSTNVLRAGSHPISAAYSGDSLYTTGQSAVVSQAVSQANAAITLASSLTTAADYGTPVTFTATVTPAVITGAVTFFDGTNTLGTAQITSGQAVFTISTLDPGSHSITASLAGTSDFVGAASTTVSTPVNPSATSVTFDCGASPCGTSVYGAAANFTVAVTITGTQNPKEKTPAGRVDITVLKGGANVCPGDPAFDLPVALSGGRGSAQTAALTTDVVAICAKYQGDAFYQASLSTPLAWTVTPAVSATALASDATANPAPTGVPITFTATVTRMAGSATPTGNVTFTDTTQNQQIGNTNLDNNGQTKFVTATLLAGQHSITATYNGDANYQASTSSAVALTLKDMPVITSLSLNHAPSQIGLAINGIHFGAGGAGSKVEFVNGTTQARTTLTLVPVPGAWSDQVIKVTVPGIANAVGSIVVTNPNGTSSAAFEIVSAFNCP